MGLQAKNRNRQESQANSPGPEIPVAAPYSQTPPGTSSAAEARRPRGLLSTDPRIGFLHRLRRSFEQLPFRQPSPSSCATAMGNAERARGFGTKDNIVH